jgi:cystathionine beta-lyase/cystathionine gamma-synthase
MRLVTSLGGVARLVNHPVSTSHRNVDEVTRERSGIHAGLLRLAVGIESVDDLNADLARGLGAASRKPVMRHWARKPTAREEVAR